MSDLLPRAPETDAEPLLDTLLREAVPEIKLALGDLIDRENQRAIPDRYQKMLPESTLVVTLRPDAGEAVQPVAAELERELTDSCMRHGSLYDRAYRVRLRAAPNPGAPLFRVSVRRGDEPEPQLFVPARRQTEPAPAAAQPLPVPPVPTGPSAETVAAAHSAGANETVIAPRPAEPARAAEPARPAEPARAEAPSGPSMDPDATRLDGIEAAPAPAATGGGDGGSSRFEADRFELVVESEEGEEKERFPIPAALTTVGRKTDNPALGSDVTITDAPHVSRRQLALVWAPRGDGAGFTVYNVGLNPLHVGEREVPGANAKGELELGDLMMDHTEWVAPGTEMVIGEHGPVLRIADTREGEDAGDAAHPEVEVDPDATRFG